MKKIILTLMIALAFTGILAPLSFADNCGVTKTDVIKSIVAYTTEKSDIQKEQVIILIKTYLGTSDCSAPALSPAKQKASEIDESIIPRCSDGTKYSHCSTAMPKYCYSGRLINRCGQCCESGRCIDGETCAPLQAYPNGIPPSITITYPANNQVFATSTVTVKGTAADNVEVNDVKIKINSGSWQAATGTTSWHADVNLVSGQNTITAKAYDTSGNTQDASVIVTSTLTSPDTTQPDITIDYPADNYISPAENIMITGTASDNVAVSNVKIRINTGAWQTATGTTTWNAGAVLAPGSNTISARANDTSGNTRETSLTVTYNPPAGTNLIKNPGFEHGAINWTFFTNGTGTFKTPTPGYEGSNASKITILTPGTNVQLYQYDVALEPLTKYKLSFSAYSSSGHDTKVHLLKHGTPYTSYGLDYTANLGTAWNNFTTEFNTTGFTGNVTDARFRFWLAPYDAAGDIYYIDNIRLEKVPQSAPQAPLNPEAIPGNAKITLVWQAPLNNGSSAITNYRIYRGTSSGSETYLAEVGNTYAYIDAGLTNGQTYYYKISAKSAVGEGPQSAEANTAPSTALDPYLVAYWKFDNDATDSSGNGHAGTINGATWATGKFNKALKFDGTNDYVSVGSIASGASGTMSAWIKPGSYTEGQAIMTGSTATGTDTTARYGIYGKRTTECADGSWYTVIANGASYQYACSGQQYNSANFPLGVWTHLAITYNGTNVKFYKNGIIVNTVAQIVSGAGDAQPYSIGRLGADSVWYFNGTIDEAKIYSRTLSPAEILADYLATPGAPLNLGAAAGDAKITLSWQAPQESGSSAVTNYRIYRGTSPGSETYLTEIGNTLTYTDTGLTNGQKYFYKTAARNQAGEGPQSSEANATPVIGLNPNLVAYWKFDNDAADSTGNGHTATINGSTWTTGYLGPALKFDGINDYVSAQSIPFYTYPGLTVEAWIKTDSITGTKTIFDYGVDTVHLYLFNGKPSVFIRNSTSVIRTAQSATVLNKGSWYHLAGVYDKTKVYIYVNGTLKTSISHKGNVRNDNTYGNRIGSSLVWPAMVWGTFFNGTIDDVKIYNKSLNATEIYADYTSH